MFGWQLALAILGVIAGILVFLFSFFLPESPNIHSFKFDFSIFKNKEFWFIQSGMTFGAMTAQGVMLHIVACFLDKGASKNIAALSISIIGLVGSVGKIFWGYLTEFCKPIKLYITACIIIIIAFFLILYSGLPISNYSVVLFSILFGLGYGSFAPLFPTLAISKFKDNFGNIMGFLATGNGVGAFFSTYLLGYIYDKTGNYNLAFYFLISFVIISSFSFFLAFGRK